MRMNTTETIDSSITENSSFLADFEPCKPTEENDIKNYVLAASAGLRKELSDSFSDMYILHYKLDRHTYVFYGQDTKGAHQAIKVWTPAPWFTGLESKIKEKEFYEEIDFIDGLHKIVHGNGIVKVCDIGEKLSSENKKIIFFSTEYIERTLSDVDVSFLTLKKLVDIHMQMAELLTFIQREYGLTYRDFKPDNVLIDNSNRPYLADFENIEGLNTPNRRSEVGSVPFLSPMQAENLRRLTYGKLAHPLDYSSDMYALGTSLAEIIFKHHPENKMAKMIKRYKENNNWMGFYRRIAHGPEIRYPSTGSNALDEFLYRSRTKSNDKYCSMQETTDALASISSRF